MYNLVLIPTSYPPGPTGVLYEDPGTRRARGAGPNGGGGRTATTTRLPHKGRGNMAGNSGTWPGTVENGRERWKMVVQDYGGAPLSIAMSTCDRPKCRALHWRMRLQTRAEFFGSSTEVQKRRRVPPEGTRRRVLARGYSPEGTSVPNSRSRSLLYLAR